MLLWMLVGCLQAVQVHGNHLEGRLSLDLPEDWEVARNRVAFGNHLVVLHGPDGCCVIRAELIREDPGSRAVPLDVLAEVLSLAASENQGIHAEILGGNSIEIAGREGWATVLRRYHGPYDHLYTTIVARGDAHLVLLSLMATRDAPVRVTRDWELVINSLTLPQDPPRDAPVFEPLPEGLKDLGDVD